MIVSLKDSLKLLGVLLVCFCAVFVSTIFLNFYIDILPLKSTISQEIMPLYMAQLSVAKISCIITGVCLFLIAFVMLIFYIKIYVDNHKKIIGTLKALGLTNFKIAKSFMIFGVSVFVGCLIGFLLGLVFRPFIYDAFTIRNMPKVTPQFHIGLLFYFVILPTLVFTFLAFLCALYHLKKPALELIKDKMFDNKKVKKNLKIKNRPFLKEMCYSTLKSKKLLVFFVAFSAFCFSAMVQMGFSMEKLSSSTMSALMLSIGSVLSIISMVMSMASLIKNNSQNIAVLKAVGYSKKQIFIAIFLGFVPFLFIGFIAGTIYQYVLLKIMVDIVFKDVANMPEYSFNVPLCFIALVSFVVLYSLAFCYYLYKTNKVSVKEIMLES